jgi:CII-binding regulator of phage lambda lysogenization HflD
MPEQDLRLQLEELRNQLEQEPPLSDEERTSILTVIAQIEAQLVNQTPPASGETLVDGVNLAVERFEVSHPTLAGTLRNIMQSLVSMGI